MRDFDLEIFFTRWQHAVRHNLTASDSETVGLDDLLRLAGAEDLQRWHGLRLGYTDPRGAAWLRETIAATYGCLDASHVLCFAGAQEGIHCVMHALLSPRDHAIVVTPNYQSAETIPLGLCEVSGVALAPDHGWDLDIDALAACIRPNTRLVSINFPNNPTGKVIAPDKFAALTALCDRHGIWLFSDEVYRLVDADPSRRLAQAVDCYARGISLNGVSKGYGLPGLRVGWIACRDTALLDQIERVKHYLSICNAAPSEVLAQIALKVGAPILARNRDIAMANMALLRTFFADHTALFDWHVPEGGVVGYPLYRGAEGVEAFAGRLIEQAGILILPASVYRSDLLPTAPDRFRIGFGRADMPEGLARLRAFIA